MYTIKVDTNTGSNILIDNDLNLNNTRFTIGNI